MTGRIVETLEGDAKAILLRHVHVGRDKAVSYLPISTIKNILGLGVEDYRSIVEAAGKKCLVLPADHCCIKSGAVFAYTRTSNTKT